MTPHASSNHDIITAAESLFAEHGYAAVSMAQVAKVAGISKSNIYHHFDSKDDLYTSVLRLACQDMFDSAQQLSASEGKIAAQLRNFSSQHFQHLHQHSNITKLILRELSDANSEHSRLLAQQVFHETFAMLTSSVQQGQAHGDIRNDMDASHMAISMLALNIFLFQTWDVLQHLPNAPFTDVQHSQSILFETLWHGLQNQHPQD